MTLDLAAPAQPSSSQGFKEALAEFGGISLRLKAGLAELAELVELVAQSAASGQDLEERAREPTDGDREKAGALLNYLWSITSRKDGIARILTALRSEREAATAAENEGAAKLADEYAALVPKMGAVRTNQFDAAAEAARHIASAIRSRRGAEG